MQNVQESTEKALEQESRVESQVEAFGAMLAAFQANQTELLTLI